MQNANTPRQYTCTDCDCCGEITIVDCETSICDRCEADTTNCEPTPPESILLEASETFQTQVRGALGQEYDIYCAYSSERPLKSFDEWMAS